MLLRLPICCSGTGNGLIRLTNRLGFMRKQGGVWYICAKLNNLIRLARWI